MESEHKKLGHYEMLGPIGAGGMGEIFAARDTNLGRKVAIKKLPERLAKDRESLSRFTQEARSASALNHPNIVTIHEVGTSDGVPFIVMEYIDGSDLRSHISQGPVGVRKALDVAVQIADGLSAAHERGIVHRDLKPENIMLTRDGYAKILDFGLAKMTSPAAENDQTLPLDIPGTNPGTILGTVGYMSPEQATGRRIDFRSDQFAFGAILYELVTGQAAFQGETTIDTLSAILHHDPPAITRSSSRAPAQLAGIVRRLLEKNPDDRYSSSRDLASELRLLRERLIGEESGVLPVANRLSRRAVAFAVSAALLVALALGTTYYFGTDRLSTSTTPIPTAAVQKRDAQYLAVMRFKDLTGDERGQLVVDGFAEILTTRLARYPALQVIRAPASEDENDPAVVARSTGANLILAGSMMREGDRIRVTWNVTDTSSRREWRDLVEGSTSELFRMQDQVAQEVARQLGLGQLAAQQPLDPAVSQRLYLEAIGHLLRYDRDSSLDSAIGILNQLGQSPSVQAALARAYLHKYQNTRDPRFAAEATTAAERALAADPQNVEVNITLGELRRQTGRYGEAVPYFLSVLSQHPTNTEAVLGLAEAYKASGDPGNAELSYKRAIALQPNYWSVYNKLGAFYYVQGQFTEAIGQFEKVLQLMPDNERGYLNLGAMYQVTGRYAEALKVFQSSVSRHPTAHGYSNLGTCYYFLGRFEDAAVAFEKAVALTPHDCLYQRNLGDALRWTPGRQEEAQRAYERTITVCREAIRVNPSDAAPHISLASALAKSGRSREARSPILRALEVAPKNESAIYEAAVIANIDGSEDEAIARIEQLLRLNYNVADLERDPEFANLRRNGRLRAVIESLRPPR
jgi:eukaryotic-like serine/threonine-protein kinase